MKPNIQIWPIVKIVPYEKNAKKHPKDQVSRIASSIKQFGWTQPIVVDRNGVIIAGHGRRLAALELQFTEVPVWVRDDLDDDQVRALRLADNRVAESTIDVNLFRQELEGLDFDLTGIFDAKELQFQMEDLGRIDTGAFVDDVSAAVDAQTEEVHRIAEESPNKPVGIHRVLGFKTVAGAHQLILSRFMALIEHETGVTGEFALVEFARRTLEKVSQ